MKNTTTAQKNTAVKKTTQKHQLEKTMPLHTHHKSLPKYSFIENLKLWLQPWTYQFQKRLDYLAFLKDLFQQYSIEPSKKYVEINADIAAKLFAEATVGIQHRQPNIQLPCQDAAKVSNKPRPILIVCDGAGSASVSDLGAQALVLQLTRLCQSLEPMIAPLLDSPTAQDCSYLLRVIIRHAIGVLQDCAATHRRSIRDFRSTLNFALVGSYHTLWIRVGDGEIIQEQIFSDETHQLQSEYHFCGEISKDEFANQTQFIDDQLKLSDVRWGILDSRQTTGLVLMSDGATEKLINHRRNQVAGQITQWLQQLRQEQLKVADIFKRFYSEDFLNRSTGDDRAIALYSREYQLV